MRIYDKKIQIDPVIERYKKEVAVGLIRENLKLTVTERILKLQEHLIFADGLRRAGQKAQVRES